MPAFLLAALALFATAPRPAPPDLTPGAVVVNEILYDLPGSALEFIEILNRTDRAVALDQLTFSDSRATRHRITDDAAVLPPGGYAVLVREGAAFEAAFPGVPFVEPATWPTLNNGGDAVVLRSSTVVLDSVAYSPAWGGRGVSLERRDPAAPANAASNWGDSAAPGGATPGRENSRFAPDRSPPVPVFAEQVEEAVLWVTFDEAVDPASAGPAAFRIGGRAAAATHPETDTRIAVRFAAPIEDALLHVRRVRDVVGNRLEAAVVPIARRPRPGALVVNEILYAPRTDRYDGLPDQPEYVELLNLHPYPVSLAGLYLTDTPDERGAADTLRLAAEGTLLAPGGFAVVYAAPLQGPEVPSRLAAAFPSVSGAVPAPALLPFAAASLGLGNSGDLVRLHRRDGAVLDDVPYTPAWHHAGLAVTTGLALERIVAEGPSADAANWTTSTAPEGGTPGRRNLASVALPEGPAEPGLTLVPPLFTPDADGQDDVVALQYRFSRDAPLLRVRIFDSRGRLVRRLAEAHLGDRSGHLLWDGLGDGGRRLRTGVYIVLLEAVHAAGSAQSYKRTVVLVRGQ